MLVLGTLDLVEALVAAKKFCVSPPVSVRLEGTRASRKLRFEIVSGSN